MTTFANRYVSIQHEVTTYGSGSATEIYGEVDDESIVDAFDILDRGDISYWGMTKSQNGKEYSEGDINFVLQADDFCGLLFYGVMGNDALDTNIHTMTDAITNSLPSFTVKVGRETKEHVYTGMCINRLSISASLGEYVTMSVGFVGKAESAMAGLTASPSFDGRKKDGMHFVNASVKFNEDATASPFVKSFSMELNNNLDTDNACAIGSNTYTRQPPMQRREVTGTIEFNQPLLTASLPSGGESAPTYDTIIASGGLEVNPGGATDYAIRFLMSDGEVTSTIDLFDVRYEAPSGTNVSGRDTTTMSLNYRAYVDIAGSTPAYKMIEIVHTGIATTSYTTL